MQRTAEYVPDRMVVRSPLSAQRSKPHRRAYAKPGWDVGGSRGGSTVTVRRYGSIVAWQPAIRFGAVRVRPVTSFHPMECNPVRCPWRSVAARRPRRYQQFGSAWC